ncbi:MAG: alpha/beta fold hydrolase [Desulfobacteraceae bacterium]|nr:MAG: alpha/beta fold hydrolase [Desulfobacteraceae bacterium]
MDLRLVAIPCLSKTLAGALFVPAESAAATFPCLILCHGAFEFKENFYEMADGLRLCGIAAVVIDMPGHGDSFGDRYHIDIGLWVQAIRTTIDFIEKQPEIDPRRIGVFGFSSGGTAVLEAALGESRLKALITLDATVRNYLGFWDTFSFKALNIIGHIKKKLTGKDLRLDLVHLLKAAQVASDPAVNQSIVSNPKMIAAYAEFPLPGAAPCAFVDTITRTHKISIPTLVIHGEEDHVDSPQTARLLYDSLTCEKSLEFISPSGHCGHLDSQKNRVLELTKEWAFKYLN